MRKPFLVRRFWLCYFIFIVLSLIIGIILTKLFSIPFFPWVSFFLIIFIAVFYSLFVQLFYIKKNNLIIAKLNNNELQLADDCYQQLLTNAPNLAVLNRMVLELNWALIICYTGDIDQAISRYLNQKKVPKRGPIIFLWSINLCYFYLLRGNHEEAQKYFTKAEEHLFKLLRRPINDDLSTVTNKKLLPLLKSYSNLFNQV